METRLNNNMLSDILMEFDRQAREANALGRIFEFLSEHGIKYDEVDGCDYDKERAKILIIGQSSISNGEAFSILKSMNIPKDRVELHLEYDDAKKFRWRSLRYSRNYSDIIVSSMPHSVEDKDEFSSIISRIEQEDGWPHLVRASANSQLKLTKSSLKEAIRNTEFYIKQLWNY